MAKTTDLLKESFNIMKILLIDSLLSVVIFFLASILTYVNANLMKSFIDSLISLNNFNTVLYKGFGLLVVVLISYVLSFIGEYILRRIGVKAFIVFSNKMLSTLYSAKYIYLKSGDILTRFISDLYELSSNLAGVIPALLIQLSRLGVMIYTLYVLSPRLLLIAISLTFPSYIIYKISVKRIVKYSSLERSYLSKLVNTLKNVIDNLLFIKRFNIYEYFREKFSRSLSEWSRYLMRYMLYTIFFNKSYFYLNSIIRIIVLIIGGWLVLNGYFTVGTLIAFTSVLPEFYEPIINLANMLTGLSGLIPYLDRYYEILNMDKEDLYRGIKLQKVNRIEFSSVSLSIKEKKILDNISFALSKGEWIGIVGPIGSGKTSLALTLIRLYEPTSGVIRINGLDYKEYSLFSLREKMVYVSSKEPIIHGSLRENISLDKEYSSDKLRRIINIVGIDFADLEDIIDPEKLSEGQKQKIALARALIREPDVLILDEATNSLDPQNESFILQNIRKYLEDSIIIIISHRFSSLKNVDTIYVLRNGRFIARGKHEELLKKCQLYSELMKEYSIFHVMSVKS